MRLSSRWGVGIVVRCRISQLVHAALWQFLRKYICLKFKEILFVPFALALKFFFVSYICCPVCGGLFLVQLAFFLIRLHCSLRSLISFFMSNTIVSNVSLVNVDVLESALDLFDVTIMALLEWLALLRV